MEGFIFFWLFWIFWIGTTFFMSRESKRLKISIWLLLTIILSIHSITIFGIEVALSSLFILFTTYYLIGKQNKKLSIYLFISSFLIMLAYTTFHLFELYDPVWVIFNRSVMLSMLLVYIAVLLHFDVTHRILSTLCGAVHGDILYSLLLRKVSLAHPIGLWAFLDIIAISAILLMGISGFKKLSIYFENHIKHLEREKQKLS